MSGDSAFIGLLAWATILAHPSLWMASCYHVRGRWLYKVHIALLGSTSAAPDSDRACRVLAHVTAIGSVIERVEDGAGRVDDVVADQLVRCLLACRDKGGVAWSTSRALAHRRVTVTISRCLPENSAEAVVNVRSDRSLATTFMP